MSREMFVYNFTMSNLVSVFSHTLRHRIWEKRIVYLEEKIYPAAPIEQTIIFVSETGN